MKARAGVLFTILGLHACLFLAQWHGGPKPSPLVASPPLTVTVALPPRPEPATRPARTPDKRTHPVPAATPLTADPSTHSTTVDASTPPPAAEPPPGMAGLQLQLPRNSLPVTRDNPAVQMALSDPRSNTVVPTARERADIATGSYECVYVERLPDGSLYRGPGLFDLEPNPDAMYRPSGVVGVKGMAWGRNQRCRRK